MNFSFPDVINQTVLNEWCQKYRVDLCMLFGSYATGKVHPRSDVDLSEHKLRFMGELEDRFNGQLI